MNQAVCVYNKAFKLLAQREYSAYELEQKLKYKGYKKEDIKDALTKLKDEGVQNDLRFSEAFVRVRIAQGKGRVLIEKQLHMHKIFDYNLSRHDFKTLAYLVLIKKYGKTTPKDYKQKSKQMRFLQMRGFGSGDIQAAFEKDIS